jgi:3-oxoacyl-[acyl-carrier-protein] synthase-1
MSLGVEIAALGARTPVGLSAEASAAAVRAGIVRLREWPYLVGKSDEMLIGARDPLLDASTPLVVRLVTMALAALRETVEKLKASERPLNKVHVLLTLPDERPGFSATDAAHTLRELSQQASELGVWLDWEEAGRGHAGGVLAMQRAASLIAQRKAELCLVGGVDSYLHPDTIGALLQDRQLASPQARDGFPPGEAAGFVLLGSPATLRAQRLPSLARLHGAHVAQETKLFQRNEVSRADGLTEAVSQACAGLSLPREAPAMVLCDINGQRFRSEEWGLMQMRIGQHMRTTGYQTAVDCWGDVGAASATLLTTLACRSWARDYADDSRALIWCASPNGARGALVLQAPSA